MPPAELIDGRAIAGQIQEELQVRIRRLKSSGTNPGLAFVRVGDDPASKVYVGMKEAVSAKLGIRSSTHALPAMVDPNTGQKYEAVSGHNYFYLAPNAGVVISSDTQLPPNVDVMELNPARR